MIDIVNLSAYLVALRKRARDDHEVLKDTLFLISNACMAEGEEANPIGIAGTLIELAYPGKVGPCLWFRCNFCENRLTEDDDKRLGVCVDCRIKKSSESPEAP